MLNNYSHLIYDLDGTITSLSIDWSQWHIRVKQLISQYEESAVLPDRLTHELTNDYVREYGIQFRDQLRAITEDVELSTYRNMVPNHKIITGIKSHQPSQTLYLLTSNCRSMATKILNELELTTHFRLILTRDDLDYIKPDPYAFSLLNKQNNPKDSFVMIGDTSSDSGFAKSVGIAYVDVTELI